MSVFLFAGESYYPQGGWWDYIGAFDSVDDAKARIDSAFTEQAVPAEPRSEGWTTLMSTSDTILTVGGDSSVEVQRSKIGDRVGGRGKVTDGPDERGRWLVVYEAVPEHTVRRWTFDWAHIVSDGKIVLEWSEYAGRWDLPDPVD